MSISGIPWIGLAALQPQQCHQLAWFLYGWVEREHVLNMNAFADWWIQAFAPSAGRFSPRRSSASDAVSGRPRDPCCPPKAFARGIDQARLVVPVTSSPPGTDGRSS
jgi:hypothetical protein